MAIKPRYKIWLENEAGKPIIGEGRLRILTAVRLTGSISKAARQLNLPFRNAWAKIKDAERQAGFKIVQTNRNGSQLTVEGEKLLSRFAELERSCKRSAEAKFKKVFSGTRLQSGSQGVPSRSERAPDSSRNPRNKL